MFVCVQCDLRLTDFSSSILSLMHGFVRIGSDQQGDWRRGENKRHGLRGLHEHHQQVGVWAGCVCLCMRERER